MALHKVRAGEEASSVAKPRPVASSDAELLKWLQTQIVFMDGISYALSEDGGRQLRRRANLMYEQVREYLVTRSIDTTEEADG